MGVDFASSPASAVTHLLLGVPCRLSDNELRALLSRLPQNITVLGGFLNRPELAGYPCVDLLKDERYQAENAMITAHCALRIIARELPVIWPDCPVLILGWGRIGKCLATLLRGLGAAVSVAARKETDRAMIAALGYDAQNIHDLGCILRRYRVIFNTVPCPVLSTEQAGCCRRDCLLVELASKAGIEAENVIDGRGLPGKIAPESAGKLIARTILRLCAQKEDTL